MNYVKKTSINSNFKRGSMNLDLLGRDFSLIYLPIPEHVHLYFLPY